MTQTTLSGRTALDEWLDEFPGLDQATRDAVAIALAAWRDVAHSAVLDSSKHWDRFASRLESAAYSTDAPSFLRQLCRRFQLQRPGLTTTLLCFSLPPDRFNAAITALRRHAGAVSDLVRAAKDAGNQLWVDDIKTLKEQQQ